MAAVQRTPTPITSSGRQNFIEIMEEEQRRVQEHLERRHHRRRSSGLNGTVGGDSPMNAASFQASLPEEQHRSRNDRPYHSSPYKWNAAHRSHPAGSMSQGESSQILQVSSSQIAIHRSPPLRELSSTSGSNTPSTDSLMSPEPEAMQGSSPHFPLYPSTPPFNSTESFPTASSTDSSREWTLSPHAIHHSRSRSTSDHRFLPPSVSPTPQPTLSASHDNILDAAAMEEGTWPRRRTTASKGEQSHRYSDRCQHKTLMVDGRQVHHSMMRVRVKKENATIIRAEARRSFRQGKDKSPSEERKSMGNAEKRLSDAERQHPGVGENASTEGSVVMLAEMNTKTPVDLTDVRTSQVVDQKANKEDSSGKRGSILQEENSFQAKDEANHEISTDSTGKTGTEVSEKMAKREVLKENSHQQSEEVLQIASEDTKEENRVSVAAEVHSQPSESSEEEESHKTEEGEKIHLQYFPTIPPALPRPRKEAKGVPTTSAILPRSRKEVELEDLVNRLKIQLRNKQKDKVEADEIYRRELRVRDDRIKKLNKDNARLEREKWELLRRAREAAERSVNLRTKLDLHDSTLRSTQQELHRATDELLAIRSANNSLRLLVTDLRTPTPKSDASVQVDLAPLSPPNIRSDSRRDTVTPHNFAEGDSGGALGRLATEFVTSDDWDGVSLGSSHADSRDGTPTTTPQFDRRGRERKSMRKLLSKFRRSSSSGHTQNSTTSLDNLRLSQNSLTHPHTVTTTTLLSLPGESMNFSQASNQRCSTSSIPSSVEQADSQSIIQESKHIPFHHWNTRALAAWMDVVVGMPRYIGVVRENVTSGHAILALSNSDLERRLGIAHPLHRRRLRLCIEEERTSNFKSLYPAAAELDHKWVSYSWAVDCGLAHLSALLYNGMVDGRVLNSLTKDDLKKYFKISKKIQQLSFLSGVELLRMHDFKRETIHAHRQTTSNPLYWTNKDIGEWLRSIGLVEYSNNIIGSGVHGALLFLERTHCSSDQLANILHIPSSKVQPRRHLAAQLAQLFASEDLNGSFNLDDTSSLEGHLSPSSTSPTLIRTLAVSPTSPPIPSRDHSPHPNRRMSVPAEVSSSDPDIAASSMAIRQDVARRSLRETMLHSVNQPPAVRRGRSRSHMLAGRPHSHMLNTTVV